MCVCVCVCVCVEGGVFLVPNILCLPGIRLDVCLNRNEEEKKKKKTSRVFLALRVIQTGLSVLLFPVLH